MCGWIRGYLKGGMVCGGIGRWNIARMDRHVVGKVDGLDVWIDR
jgi:hypothetical protein